MNELKLWLPELNENQLNWLQAHINLKVAEAERQAMADFADKYLSKLGAEI